LILLVLGALIVALTLAPLGEDSRHFLGVAQTKELVMSRYVLFVNLSYVTIGNVRTYSHALLLQEDDPTKARNAARCRLRGFLTDPALPTFDLNVPDFEHALSRISPPSWIPMPDDGEIREAVLCGPRWRDDIVLSAQVGSDLGIQTVSFPDDVSIDLVWRALVRGVAASWAAPRMPIKHFEDAAQVRRILGVEARLSKDAPVGRTPSSR
jgi:hypothetical protein